MTEQIEKIIKIFEKANVSKLELEIENIKLKLEKNDKEINYSTQNNKIDTKEEVILENKKYVTSPVVGTYYQGRSEKSAPFIEVGKNVKKGEVLCIIEAMKVMNEVVAPYDGKILEILVNNEDFVQFDQKLIVMGEDND